MMITGFHGTTVQTAERIQQEGFQVSFSKRPRWLGFGCYFFQDGPSRAQDWAVKIRERKKEDVVVVKAEIELRNMLDLGDSRYWDMFKSYAATCPSSPVINRQIGPEALFRKRTDEEEKHIGFNFEDHDLINRFVGWFENYKEDVYVLRAPFFEGTPITHNSWFLDEAHICICVRNPAAVIKSLVFEKI